MRLAIARRAKADEDRGAVLIDITAWDKLGELCAEHLAKGRQVAISGRLELDEWTAGDGPSPHRLHIRARTHARRVAARTDCAPAWGAP
jgi:single-stranded DNA-binding protein